MSGKLKGDDFTIKKTIAILLSLTFLLNLSIRIGLAKGDPQSEKVELSQEEKERFINLGFSEQMIEDITEKEIDGYDGETGEVISGQLSISGAASEKKMIDTGLQFKW